MLLGGSIMQKIITFFLAVSCFCWLGSVHSGEGRELKICNEGAYPPFDMVAQDGSLVGFNVDIANALCQEMEAKCELVQTDWSVIIDALITGQCDAIVSSVSMTEERKKQVAFTGKYYQVPSRFVRKKGSNTTIENLSGETVGVQSGTVQEELITTVFGDKVQVKSYTSVEALFADAESLDLMFVGSVSLQYGFLSTSQGENWEFVGPNYSDPVFFGEGAGIAVRKNETELLAEFNQALEAILKNGTYKAINDKYFDFDIYGDR